MSGIDKNRVSAAFDRAAARYDEQAEFQHRVCTRLTEKLPADLTPARILDGGCGTGYGASLLVRHYPSAELIGCDIAPEMVRATQNRGLHALCGDLENLPFGNGAFDLAWSNLALQWCQPERVYSELWRVLAPNGTLVATTLTTGSLHELNAAFSGIDSYRHTLPFTTEASVHHAILDAGFSSVCIEKETWVTRHADLKSLLSTIRGIGASHAGEHRRRSMMGKKAWSDAQERYEAMRDASGMLPVTYEVLFITARKNA